MLQINPVEEITEYYTDTDGSIIPTYKYYQIANRIAYSWWINNKLKVPTALLFLGFLKGNPASGKPFFTDEEWRSSMMEKLVDLGAEKLVLGQNETLSKDKFIMIRSIDAETL